MAGDSNGEVKQVLLATEAELYIEELKTYPLKEIGSPKWMSQHEFIEKLNMQVSFKFNIFKITDDQQFKLTLNMIQPKVRTPPGFVVLKGTCQ
ncbi:zinc finger MYND domain-containing protein 10-like [Orbicella faveolata]|uniref:zinc finger MYND domain-containing protein 10-like n=1 Tax=Orbicella faveolata TaxID=48498 RepID=UPI0009E543E7|nr:zinc finger MYND domain-containing protein 10-like [Orbicella faveolata]